MSRLSAFLRRLRAGPAEPPLTPIANPILFWQGGLPDRSISQTALLQAINQRLERYRAAQIDRDIAAEDDMAETGAPGYAAHYLSVGASAIDLIVEAMVLARRVDMPRILEFPCGGGRVTRHLVKFFPESVIAVSDVERDKQAAVVRQFGATPVTCAADFSEPLPERYDLIFVGSLLSHLDEALFNRSLDFLIRGLAPEGVLIVTTHGRYAGMRALDGGVTSRNPVLSKAAYGFAKSGFGYFEQEPTRYGVSYGAAFSAPSFVLRQIETRPDAMILGYKERAWDSAQDVLMVQKLP